MSVMILPFRVEIRQKFKQVFIYTLSPHLQIVLFNRFVCMKEELLVHVGKKSFKNVVNLYRAKST